MATDYGTDIAGILDLDPSFGTVSGTTALAQAIARRLTTPRGSLPYAPEYGTDVRLWLNDASNPARLGALRAAIEQEVEADERIQSASAAVSYDSNTQALGISIQAVATSGPFRLTLAISATTVAILNGG